ncbi:MAG: hypothetical protein Q8P53_00600 [Candidatus Shapirobacteria bacterium]|nr:hypothetical protein [Candidatus Shapirobacteria bacterium]
MKEKKIMGVIIPIVAILVILESVVLVNSLEQKNKPQVKTDTSTNVVQNVVEDKKVVEPETLGLIFGTPNKSMVVGKKYPVELNLISKTTQSLDTAEIYIKYDPTAFAVSRLTFDSKLTKPTFSKISEKQSVIVVNYLISEKNGVELSASEILPLIKFDVVPKKTGDFEFEISTGNENKESATMFIENATGKNLIYSSNKLDVQVLK